MSKVKLNYNKSITFLIGDIEKIPLNRRLLNILTLSILVGNIYSLFPVYILNLPFIIKFLNWVVIVLFLGLYLIIRYSKANINIMSTILFITISLQLSYAFLVNNGSYGPMIYLYILILIFITGLKYKEALVFIIIGLINIFLLLYIEYIKPEKITDYEDRLTRLSDIYFMLVFIVMVSYLGFKLIIKSYYYERDKAVNQKEEIETQKKLIENLMEKEKQVNQMKLDFFTNISHEFRTPLSLIKAPVEKLIQLEDNKEKIEEYQLIHKHTVHLNKLIDQLLDFRKIDINKMQLELEKIELISFLNQLIASYSSIAVKKRIKLYMNSTIDNLQIFLDKNKTEKIITNIFSNAFKYTPKNGYITVNVNLKEPANERSVSSTDNKQKSLLKSAVVIMISDSGKGIPQEYLKNIFKPFYQIPGTKYGTGIGLSLAYELAKLQRGNILASSEPDKGSTFYIGLPLDLHIHYPDNIIETEAVTEKEYEPIYYEIDSYDETSDVTSETIDKPDIKQKPRILLIEDYEDILSFLEKELNDIYFIEKARDGEQGYKIATNKQFDLIVSDIMMPKMDGVELCQKLKNDEKTSHIPIILLTAKASLDNKIEGLETGADDYIVKPFQIEEVKARIKNLIIQRKKLRERFAREIISIEPKDIVSNSKDEQFLKKAISLVETNLADPDFGVIEFTDKIGMSRSLIHLRLKSLTNQSTSEFISAIRLRKAVQIMKSDKKTISEICYEVGFNDYSYFNKRFKKLFRKSPMEYFEFKS